MNAWFAEVQQKFIADFIEKDRWTYITDGLKITIIVTLLALILGLILGGTAESGLMLSLVMAKGDVLGYYFSRPICLVLMALIVLSIAGPVISHMRAKKKTAV